MYFFLNVSDWSYMKEKALLCKSHHAKQRLCVSVRGRPYVTLVCMSVPACKAGTHGAKTLRIPYGGPEVDLFTPVRNFL